MDEMSIDNKFRALADDRGEDDIQELQPVKVKWMEIK